MSSVSARCFTLVLISQNTNRTCIKLMAYFYHVNGFDGHEISNEFNIAYIIVSESQVPCSDKLYHSFHFITQDFYKCLFYLKKTLPHFYGFRPAITPPFSTPYN